MDSHCIQGSTLCNIVLHLSQGLKRNEQHALTELFKSKLAANSAESAYSGEKGRIQPIKKLERLMKSATFSDNK